MRPTFTGFEAMRKALMASQKQLDITGQNIANVNTEGYTRQRVDLTALSIDNGVSRFVRARGDNIGQGVEITGITQIRDQFLDARFRKDVSEYGRWETRLNVLTDIENVLDEISADGLHAQLNDFYSKLEEFSKNPESIEFATVFRSSAQKVTEIFNQYARQLQDIKEQHIFNTGVVIADINTIAQKLADLNKEIRRQLLSGSSVNELYDVRNLLLDKLAESVGATFEFHADGGVSAKIGSVYLVDASNNDQINDLSVDSSGYPLTVKWQDGSVADIQLGQIAGYLETINGKGVFAAPGEETAKGIAFFEQSLNELAASFANAFNDINDPTGTNKLFDGDALGNITAASIRISNDWLADAKFITTTTVVPVMEGRNDNLLRMIDCMNTKHNITPYFEGTFEEYITALIGDMAVEADYSNDMKTASEVVLNSIRNERESVMGVSLDEEAINMVKFQKSYNAAARMITVLDELLDVLINKTGIVGR